MALAHLITSLLFNGFHEDLQIMSDKSVSWKAMAFYGHLLKIIFHLKIKLNPPKNAFLPFIACNETRKKNITTA